MKIINKSHKLDNVHYAIRGGVLEEASRLEENGINILKLNIGDPAVYNFYTPNYVLDCVHDNLKNAQGYSESKGLKSARKSIIDYYKTKNVDNININNIYIGNGVSELITLSMQALLNTNDEILVPMPDYPLWTASVNLAGGKAVHYLCDENNEWYPSIEDIEAKITENTKGIVIINPNNPTGSVYPKEVLQKIIGVARKNDIIIFCDEIYDRLVYDELEHVSIASLSKEVPTITFSGLSKSHMIPGFRIGWMCITGDTKKIANYIDGLNLLASMRLCANVPAQYIVEKAIKDISATKELLSPGGRLYEQREYIYNALKKIDGISVVKPKAAFYIFPKIDTTKIKINNDEKFTLDFLREKGILVTHGTGFNYNEPNHFRIVFLPDKEKLEYAVENLNDFLGNYNQEQEILGTL